MREILLVAMALVVGNVSYGAQIVYPKSQNVTIKSDKTFFVGNEQTDKVLKINGEIINLHQQVLNATAHCLLKEKLQQSFHK